MTFRSSLVIGRTASSVPSVAELMYLPPPALPGLLG